MNLRGRCGDRRLPARVRRAVRLLGAVLVLLPAWVAEAQTLVRGPYLQSGTASSVIIKWRTDEATDSLVRYGLAPDSLTLSVSDATSTTEHAVQLTGLSADVKYFYAVGTSADTLAGGDDDHFVVTAPVPGTAKPTRIWVIGDSGTADRSAEAVRDAFLNFTWPRDPDLWIMLGDNAYEDGTDAEYQAAVFETYPQVLRKIVLWPTLGNHDGSTADSTTESSPYYDIFSLPRNGEAGGVASGTEAYYSFDYGNIHFIVLDSYETDRSPDGAMMTWLARDLAANDKEWIIAFWHHPPYSRGSYDSNTQRRSIALRQNAVPLLERYGVDLVLSGHSHSYERSYLIDGHYGRSDTITDALKKNPGDGSATGDGAYQKPATVGAPHAGAVYAVAGTAGKLHRGPLDHRAMAVSLRSLGSMVLDVNGNRLDAIFLDSTGNIQDDFTILKLPEVSGSVAENTAAGEGIVTVADENPEDDLRYSLAGRNGHSDHTPFTITTGGELQTRAALDYERPTDADGNGIYEVVVKKADTDDSILVTIRVTDEPEAGTIRLSPDEPQALTPLTATLNDPDRDPDNPAHAVIWQWERSDYSTGPWTVIGGETAASYTPQVGDVTRYLRATAHYQDRLAASQTAFSDASTQVRAAPQVVLELKGAVDNTITEGQTVKVIAKLTGGTVDAETVVTVTVDGDFELTGDTLTIAPGAEESTGTVRLTTVDDDVDTTRARIVRVTGMVPSGSRVTRPEGVMLTIADNDERGVTLSLSEPRLSVPEGGEKTYTLVLASKPTADVTVTVATTSGSSEDVSVSLSRPTFTATNWNQPLTVTVKAQDDADEEDDEARITHTVSGGDYNNSLTFDVPSVSVTVEDDEGVSTAVELTVSPDAVNENTGENPNTAQVTVTGRLNGKPLADNIDVTLSVMSGTATLNKDFTVANVTTLTIPADSLTGTATFELTLRDDEIDEPNETVTVGGSTDLAVLPDGVTGAELPITDNDDPPTVELVLTPNSITEDGGTTSTVTATLTGGITSSVETEVEVSAVAESPATDQDFRLSPDPATLTIPAGKTTSDPAPTVTLTAVDNDEFTLHQTVTVSGSVPSYDLPDKPNNPAEVKLTITDDERPTVRSTDATRTTYDDYAYTEGEQTPVDTYTATNPDTENIEITWRLEGADAEQFTITETSGVLRFKHQPPAYPGTPDYEDPNNPDKEYRVTVIATPTEGAISRDGSQPVTVAVRDAPGKLCLSAFASACRPLTAPQVGREVYAILEDPDVDADRPATNLTWGWERVSDEEDLDEDGTPLDNHTASYTPAAEDVGHSLRVTVTYTDGDGTGIKAPAQVITDEPVRRPPRPPGPPSGPPGGPPSDGPPAEERPPLVGYLENPGPNSFQSGIGVISGWVCEAERVVIELETAQGAVHRYEAGYGTPRADTAVRKDGTPLCGDTDNGFGLLFNWNRLGEGEHEVVASVDGVELGRAVVRVTTVGEEAEEEFLRGAEGECVVEDFPRLGQSVLLEWQQNSQNFVITDVE